MIDTAAPGAAVAAAIAGLWREVLATGRLPAAATPVRTRLVRAVGHLELPGGRAFVKVMAFPRAGDRLRYLLRPLPAAREAAMLAQVERAGIPCPEVLAVHTARRGGVPFRSMLVLRALPVAAEVATGPELLRERADIAQRLAAAGRFHPDLNPDNFVRLRDGRLALLDVQSLRRAWSRRRAARAMAARLLLDAVDVEPQSALAVLADAGLVAAADRTLATAAMRIGRAWLRSRVQRCWRSSTEFTRRRVAFGVREHARRGAQVPGWWLPGGRELASCWEGQRLLEVLEGRRPTVTAIRRRSPWLVGDWSVYVPATFDVASARAELEALAAGHRRLHGRLFGSDMPTLGAVQEWRARAAGEATR